jgi:hypothetical protein
MIFKTLKYGLIGTTGAVLLGALVFGRELTSYVRCSARSMQSAVQDAVPLEFELERAREMVERIIPEMNSQVRLIAQEEVEVEELKLDVRNTEERLEREKRQIVGLRDQLATKQVSLVVNGVERSRDQLAQQLQAKFRFHQESTDILASKRKLLETRMVSLEAARDGLARAKTRKGQLEQQIEGLAARHRQLKASAVGTHVEFDASRLNRAEKLIAQITKRLAIAERIMQHESETDMPTIDDVINENVLFEEIDEYFGSDTSDSHESESSDEA